MVPFTKSWVYRSPPLPKLFQERQLDAIKTSWAGAEGEYNSFVMPGMVLRPSHYKLPRKILEAVKDMPFHVLS